MRNDDIPYAFVKDYVTGEFRDVIGRPIPNVLMRDLHRGREQVVAWTLISYAPRRNQKEEV